MFSNYNTVVMHCFNHLECLYACYTEPKKKGNSRENVYTCNTKITIHSLSPVTDCVLFLESVEAGESQHESITGISS